MAGGKYSCKTASETLEWITAIIHFLKPYKPLMDSHVVNFFKDRLWESIHNEWMDCLRAEPLEILLNLPSGLVQDHWPQSLKEFILTLRSLVFPRDQVDLQMMLPNLLMTPVNGVLAQGMNLKKKHEVEILAAVVNSIAKTVRAQTVLDIGAGQGYLAQVLTFQYQLSVVAIDASSHHSTVTSARATRIMKHYAAKMRKSQTGTKELRLPQTVAFHVLSSDALKALSNSIAHEDIGEQRDDFKNDSSEGLQDVRTQPPSGNIPNLKSSLVLAGLHACGDLSVTMLRTFLDCEEIKAVISIGCCYNLLSEEGFENVSSQRGFPMSCGVDLAGFSLGKSARDLACQSAERWRLLNNVAAFQNFQLHAFRAAFQMVLHRYYPEVLTRSPSIGRQGKALRRQQVRKVLQNHPSSEESGSFRLVSSPKCHQVGINCSTKLADDEKDHELVRVLRDGRTCSTDGTDVSYPGGFPCFEKFCESGLRHLDLKPSPEINIRESWMQNEPYVELIRPYWTLKACLGPLVETLLLLDRLLFLQEKGTSVEAVMLPIFDPLLSPRNVAIIAHKI